MDASPDSGFDRVAGVYDSLARLMFGDTLQHAQEFFLPLLPKEASFLVVGGGSGRILGQVLSICKPTRVVYLEASQRMLHMARQRNGKSPVVEYRLGNEWKLRPNEHFDIVVTPFLLDLFSIERLQFQLLPRLSSVLVQNGYWLCTDFTPPQKLWQRFLLWSMYQFFGYTAHIEARTIADWPLLLESYLSLQREKSSEFWQGFIKTGIWRKYSPVDSVSLSEKDLPDEESPSRISGCPLPRKSELAQERTRRRKGDSIR